MSDHNPPDVHESIPLPHNRGQSAAEYLESQGLVACSPPIHASDDGKDEFLYYLSRRLGLVPATSVSDALTTGSYFHLAAEHFDEDADHRSAVLRTTLESRLAEIGRVAKVFHLSVEEKARLEEHENKHGRTGFAIFEAVQTLPVNTEGTTLRDFLTNPATECLGRELRVQVQTEWGPAVAIFDRLMYHEAQNTIWIDDYKTHDGEPLDRAQVCPLEMQTWHYLHIAKILLQSGWLRDNFNVPLDARIGGMRHIIVRKPSITLSAKDAPCEYFSEGKKKKMAGRAFRHKGDEWTVETWSLDAPNVVGRTGPYREEEAVAFLHAETGKAPDRRAVGEPSLDRFLVRLSQWYHGTGEYVGLAEERQARPSVVISTTYASALETYGSEYARKMERIADLRTRIPYPENFTRTGKELLSYGRLSRYAPFYLVPEKDWPVVMEVERFVINHRDEPSSQGD